MPFEVGQAVLARWQNQDTEEAWGKIVKCYGNQSATTGEADDWYGIEFYHMVPGRARVFYVSYN